MKLTQKQTKVWISGIFLLIIVCLVYWHRLQRFPSTDDAYVQANVVNISAEINGRVIETPAAENQFVQQGTLLFQIDPKPYELAVTNAEAQLALAKQQLGANEDAVSVAQAQVNQRKAELDNTQLNYNRVTALVARNVMSKSQGDDVKAQLLVAQAALKAAEEQLLQAQHQLGDDNNNNAQIRSAQTQLEVAQLNLNHTKIIAPSDGYVTHNTLRVGDMVQAGQPLFAFVEKQDWWVDANYKETQLKNIKPGQSAIVIIDSYPNRKFNGRVESISTGSGSAFSLLPPENATGNWVKVTQRVPVRIKIMDADPSYPLRVGLSSIVTIDTASHS